MHNYYNKLVQKSEKYAVKYTNRPRFAALKMIFWNLGCIFKKQKTPFYEQNTRFKNDKKLYIAFVFGGGIGDIVMRLLYISKLVQRFDCPHYVTAFVGQSVTSVKSFMDKCTFINNICHVTSLCESDFDVVIHVETQFPQITYVKNNRVHEKSQFLEKYVYEIGKFNHEHPGLANYTNTFLQLSYLNIIGKNCITGTDVGNFAKLGDDDELKLTVNKTAILKKYGLEKQKFITIQRGVDVNNSSTGGVKLWPTEYYSELIKLIKKQNPNIKIVQLGVSKDRCESVSNVDINLVGQTTFADVLTLLTKSILHIDGDCGMVHLRHFLCKKPSLVLWGPTSPKLRGYPENINLRANVCNCEFCEWLVGERWQTHCIKTNSCHGLCMEMLSPQYAFEHIKHLI